jgi:periplasmic divalent cation tolerance protein
MRKSSSQIVLVLVTTSSRKDAMTIAQALVREKQAACVNILPSVTSIFRWQGKVQRSREALLLIKTTGRRYAALEKAIRSLHSYEVPEIISIRIDRGLPQYIEWVERETTVY